MMFLRFWISLLLLCALSGWNATSTHAHSEAADHPLEGDMVYIPAGQFIFGTDKKDATGDLLSMGVPKPLYEDERPLQKPFLKGYYIDRYEVTHQRYKVFVEDLGYVIPEYWENGTYPPGQENHPVIWVSWFDAANFCDWAGKRLPTEKEWERAARGQDGREYPWGSTFQTGNANLPVNSRSQTKITAVGSFPKSATPLGIHDLVGNVWEWVNDDYKAYPGNDKQNENFDQGFKVLRGASVANIGHFPGEFYEKVLKEFARGGYRQFAPPESGEPDVGFRCASASPPKHYKDPNQKQAGAGPLSGFSGSTGSGNANTDSLGSSDFNSFSSEGINPFEPDSSLPKSGMLVLSLLSLLAGLFSFLSPCTLPILPAYFAVTAQTSRTRMTLNSFAFFCGLASLFILMGASASFLGSLLRDYLFSLTTWGGILVLIFGIMTIFGKGFSGATFRNAPTSTFIGYYFFGATFAMGWTPCVGPVLSGILILAASERTIVQGMLLLFFFAVGLGSPLIMLASFFSHLSKDSWFWKLLRGKAWHVEVGNHSLLLHTTNLFSGLLLVILGVALWQGYLSYFNSQIPLGLQIWFGGIEEKIVHWLS